MRAVAATLATVLLLGACGGGAERDAPAAPGTAATGETLTAPNTTPLPVTTPAVGAMERAAATALRTAPGTALTSIETEGGGWEVGLVGDDGTEREILVDGAGTRVVRNELEQDEGDERDEGDEDLARVREAKLDHRDAADAIRASVPGARITELNLDARGGTVVWESDVIGPGGARYAPEIDARTGRVLRR